MTQRHIAPAGGPAPVGPYSPGVAANGFLFVSGQIPLNPQTGELVQDSFEHQARQTLENLKRVVEAAGSSLEQVVKVTIFLSDLTYFDALNRIYAEYFSESRPARSTVQAARLPKDVDVEIEAIALLPE
ncbi:MAG TPA: RidA family protein [bacterium]|nr:RidA family protein [Candidatus Omnitrophota bacterium]HOJ61403.1 RidA family protein [bacterium]HOL95430.1 RidA family protein [bacterium]HPP01113.1 RidA family protein [bacterium]HXK92220.1 RidA family protein [bacterium]